MVKTRKSAAPERSVLRNTRDTAHLRVTKLVTLAGMVRLQGLRVVVIFARHADRTRARPMVFSALCRPVACAARNRSDGKRPFAQNALNGAMPLVFARR